MKRMMLAVLFAAGLSACFPNYSTGTRVGVVTKLSEKGVILKSWEGELLMALPAGMSAVQAEKFTFTVEPEAVAQVQEAMRTGRRVELTYHQWLYSPPNMETNYA
jgi:hypothetical protein